MARRWAKLDAEFLSRPRVIDLLGEFGPAGPLLLVALVLEVERTPTGRATDSVEARYADLGERTGVSPTTVQAIAERAQSMGLVAISQERDPVTGREAERLTLLQRRKWSPAGSRGTPEAPPRRVPTDRKIVALLSASGPLRGQEIADRLGLVYGGSFRARLGRLVKAGELDRSPDGYTHSSD